MIFFSLAFKPCNGNDVSHFYPPNLKRKVETIWMGNSNREFRILFSWGAQDDGFLSSLLTVTVEKLLWHKGPPVLLGHINQDV